MSETINSSEELQRHNASVFAQAETNKDKSVNLTELEKVKKLLDMWIEKYSKTSSVREMAVAAKRSADHQLDLSADVVIILEKIKSELR